jgi:hypothetical protein
VPITGMYWGFHANHDIHVLRGQSTSDLRLQALKFRIDANPANDLTASAYLAQFPDVTLTFTPIFKGAMQGDNFVGDNNGITVDTTSGIVTVNGTMPANRKNNFILEVLAKNTANASSFNETIRIQVHGSVSQVWLSPQLLTVRMFGTPGTTVHTSYRFSVRALFDDNLMGDLTDGHGVTWTEAGGHIDQDGKISILPADNVGDSLPVSATLPASLGGATTPAGPKLDIEQAWSELPNPPRINVVAGGAVPETGTVEDMANVLMVGDGFGPGDEAAFDQIVDTFVHFLTSNTLTKPFNLFSSRMIFWKLLFPATQMGITLRSEMATLGIAPYAVPVPAAKKPAPDPPAPAPPTQWTIQNLLYMVGLPIPGDDLVARTPTILKEEWRKLFQKDPLPNIGPDPQDQLVNEWKSLARRVLVEEQNNFPGLAYGSVPAANNHDTTLLHLHEDRSGAKLLKGVCGFLGSDDATLKNAHPVGALFAADDPGFRYLNRDFVVVISSCPGGRAANQNFPATGRCIYVTSGPMSPFFPLSHLAGQVTYTLNFSSASPDVEASASRVLAHELSHSMCLGDEYPEFLGTFPSQSADVSQVGTQHFGTSQRYGSETPYRDYGLFATFRGPGGNSIIVIYGTRDEGVQQTAEAFATPEKLAEFSRRTETAQSFKALIEVNALDGANMGGKLLLESARDYKNR